MSTVAKSPKTNIVHPPETKVVWPPKYDLFGLHISATSYEEIIDVVARAAKVRVPSVISMHAVHAVIESISDDALLAKVNRFDAIAPDGQPVRWALNQLYRTGLKDRVAGPELMPRLCERAVQESIPIYLYGSTPKVIALLEEKLPARFPGLIIAGAKSPPFRALTAEEDAETVERINNSGAGIVFIGLGCPKQDHFAADHAGRIRGVQVCVGAAFEFHAGTKSMAPQWMSRNGLEWVYRLGSEPRRLWRRYLQTNSKFLFKWFVAAMRKRPLAPVLRSRTAQHYAVSANGSPRLDAAHAMPPAQNVAEFVRIPTRNTPTDGILTNSATTNHSEAGIGDAT